MLNIIRALQGLSNPTATQEKLLQTLYRAKLQENSVEEKSGGVVTSNLIRLAVRA